MAKLLTIRDNDLAGALTPANIVGDAIFVSEELSNTHQSDLYKGAEITLSFDNLVSDDQVHFQAILEGKTSTGKWIPRAYQFDSFRASNTKQDRVILADPSILWLDAGISNIVYVGNKTIAEISPQAVTLPETWRIVVKISGLNNSFVSLDLDIDAELINVQQ